MIIDADKLSFRAIDLKNHLLSKVIGQEEAIEEITYATQKYFAGLGQKQKPITTFLFTGPTGTGKTKLVEEFYNYIRPVLSIDKAKEKDPGIVKVNCGEYQQSHEIAKIIGSPPGYLGHNETKPAFSKERIEAFIPNVILFDEIEKASDSLSNLLLGILDKAELQLGNNTTVKFENCFIFMTSNEGVDQLNREEKNIGFHKNNILAKSDSFLKNSLKTRFKPEFINRIDKIITFKTLSHENNLKILDLELGEIQERLIGSYKKIILSFTPEIKEYIVNKTYSKEYGARFLKRYLEKEIVIRLSNILFMDDIKDGDVIMIDVKEDKFIFEKLDKKKSKGNTMKVSI